jgi:hypothetical protein
MALNRYLDKKNKVSSCVVLVIVALVPFVVVVVSILLVHVVVWHCAWYQETEIACEMIQDVGTTCYCLGDC